MGNLKTARILATVSGWLLIVLPLLELFFIMTFISSMGYGNIIFRMAPVFVILSLGLRYICAFVILWMSRKRAALTRQAGITFLVIGVLVAFVGFAQISMIVGIMLIVAGYQTISHFSKSEFAPATAAYGGFVQSGYRPTPDANPFYNTALQQAVYQFQTGDKTQAYQSFKNLQYDNPNDINLLLWLAYSAPDLEIAYTYIKRAASIQPDSPSVAQAWLWLKSVTGVQA